jgi:hypothetical protein
VLQVSEAPPAGQVGGVFVSGASSPRGPSERRLEIGERLVLDQGLSQDVVIAG